MKIKKLEINGFGKFRDDVFELNEQNQLIYGVNESGKSTLYQFIRTMLFGFPKKREMVRDFTPIHGSVYGGRLILEHPVHGKVIVERFKEKQKGQARVILEDGQEGNDALLEKLLHPLNQETFDQIFSFQHEQLTDLTHLNEVKLQHLLLSVGLTGSERLTKINDDFLKERQKVFKPTGRIPVLNQKLKTFKKLESHIQEAENQESYYQEKSKQHQELSRRLLKNEAYDKELLNQEMRLKEQQKRFPLYVEWTSLNQEIGVENEASSSLMARVNKEIQDYEFLENKEKRLLEKQGQVMETEAPAFRFYLQNQPLFEELLEEQVAVETTSERRIMLDEQLKDYQQSKAELFDKYKLSHVILDHPVSESDEEEMQDLSIHEEALVREKLVLGNEKSRLSIRRKELDTALTTTEGQLDDVEVGNQGEEAQTRSTINMFSGLSLAISILFLLLAVVLGKGWLFIPTLTFIGLGVYGFMSQAKKKTQSKTPVSKEAYLLQLNDSDELEHDIHQLDQQQRELEERMANIASRKNDWASEYGFSTKENISTWLTKLPVFVQLQSIQEKETEMLENLNEVDRVLQAYADLLEFAKQWIPLENKSPRDSYQAVKEFVVAHQEVLKEQQTARSDASHFQADLREIRRGMAQCFTSLENLLSDITLHQVSDAKRWLEQQQDYEKNKSRLIELSLAVEDYFDLTKSYQLLGINQTLMRLNDKQDELHHQMKNDQALYQKLSYELRKMEENGSLDELYQERENQVTVIKQLTTQWLSFRVAEELTQDLFQFLSDQQLPALLTTVSSYFRLLTDDTYQHVFVKQGQLLVKDSNHQTWPVIQLSTGTKDQLYIAFRLGFIQLHAHDYGSPVVIDDGWLHFDTKRKETLFRLLQAVGKQTQVICLSSDETIKTYFKAQHQAILTLEGMGS